MTERTLLAAMGEQENVPFRFLSEDEFFKLEAEAKVLYLVRAQKELDARQRMVMRRPESDDKDN